MFDNVIYNFTFSQQVKFVEFSISCFEVRPDTCALAGSQAEGNSPELHCQEHPRDNLDRTYRLYKSGMSGRAARNSFVILFCSQTLSTHLSPAALFIKQSFWRDTWSRW